MYDNKRFTDAGFRHYELYFPDGSCPPDTITARFLDIAEREAGKHPYCTLWMISCHALRTVGDLLLCPVTFAFETMSLSSASSQDVQAVSSFEKGSACTANKGAVLAFESIQPSRRQM